jgi:DNA-binding transcriptional LysR family regulator
MNFEYLSAFIAIAESGSFSKASRDLYLSQPTISRYISALEKELGASLLVRDKRTNSILLTDSGQQFYNDCKKLMKQYAIAEQRVRDINAGNGGKLVIQNIPPAWKELYDISRLFLQKYPNVTISILNEGQPPHAIFDKCDIKVMQAFELMHYADLLKSCLIRHDPYVVLVSPENPLGQRESISLYELQHCSIVDSGGMCRSVMLTWNLEPPINSFVSMETSILELYRTDAVMIATQSAAESFASVTTQIKLELPNNLDNSIHLCWDKNITNPLVPLFIDTAVQYRREHFRASAVNTPMPYPV